MGVPAIVWRNPNSIQHRRVWNRAKRDACRSLYVVVEAVAPEERKWKGLPTLEIIEGGATASSRQAHHNHRLPSGA
jgi:hypothetical protein